MMVQSPISFTKKQSMAMMNIESNTMIPPPPPTNEYNEECRASSSSSLPAAEVTVTTATTTTTTTSTTPTNPTHPSSLLTQCGSKRHYQKNGNSSHHLATSLSSSSLPPPAPRPHRSTTTLEYQWIQNVSFPVFILDPIKFVIVTWNTAATRLSRIKIHYHYHQQQQQQQLQDAVLCRSIDNVFRILDNDDNHRQTDDSPFTFVQQHESRNLDKTSTTMTTATGPYYPSSSIAHIISRRLQALSATDH
jgi:hypothetical protein